MSVPHKWDLEADVAVVGFGAAGVAASVTAHDLGAEVVILEKAPEGQEGGNTRVAGQGYLNTSSPEDAAAYLTALCGPYAVRRRCAATMPGSKASPDFGRALMLAPIVDKPLYAVELSPSMLNTQGGPRRNEKGQICALTVPRSPGCTALENWVRSTAICTRAPGILANAGLRPRFRAGLLCNRPEAALVCGYSLGVSWNRAVLERAPCCAASRNCP